MPRGNFAHEEAFSWVKGICAGAPACQDLHLSSQNPLLGERRVVKLPGLQTQPNEALGEEVSL